MGEFRAAIMYSDDANSIICSSDEDGGDDITNAKNKKLQKDRKTLCRVTNAGITNKNGIDNINVHYKMIGIEPKMVNNIITSQDEANSNSSKNFK